MTKEQKFGHLAMLGASVMWGLMAPISKAAMNSDAVSAMLVADVRIFGAAILFWIFSLFTKGEKITHKSDYIRFFFAGLFAIILNQCVYVTGVSMTSPVDASIITTTLPIVTMIFAAIFIKEPITGRKAGGVLLGACGALLLVFGNRLLPGAAPAAAAGHSSSLTGDLLCFLAQCSYAVYLVIFRDLIKRYSAVTLMKWMFTFASVIMIPVSARSLALTGWSSISLTEYAELAYCIRNFPLLSHSASRTEVLAADSGGHVQLCPADSSHCSRHHLGYGLIQYPESRGCRLHFFRCPSGQPQQSPSSRG